MIQHMNIRIQGKVQGVFYRASAKEKADEIGLKGFVQNLKDGSVYAEVEGDEDQIERFANWCRQGPSGAKVTEISTVLADIQHFEKFEIRR